MVAERSHDLFRGAAQHPPRAGRRIDRAAAGFPAPRIRSAVRDLNHTRRKTPRDQWDLAPKAEIRGLDPGPPPKQTPPLVAEPGTQSDGHLSSDDRWLVYQSAPGGMPSRDTQIMVRPFPGTEARRFSVSSGPAYQPLWSHDDREIFFRTEDGTVMSVSVSRGSTPLDLILGKPVPVVSPVNTIRDFSGPTYDVSPDGQRFLFIKAPELDIRSLEVILNWDVAVQAAIGGQR
jgi:hypothetical protein